MGIVIRKASPEDACDWADCRISCLQSSYKGIYPDEIISKLPLEKEMHIEGYKTKLADPGDNEYYSVIHSGEMIGFLVTDTIKSEILAIYLLEDFWGKGYGKEIMDFAVNELKRTKHEEIISLWVFEKNIRARQFYERYGFSLHGAKKEINRYDISLVQVKYVL